MITVLTSASGAPGTSTTALGLALVWPRPCLLIEADPTGVSATLTGYLRHAAPSSIYSLFDAAAEQGQTGHLPILWDHATPLPDTTIRLVSSIRSHLQTPSLGSVWGPLTAQLGTLPDGIDVIADAGRLGMATAPIPMVMQADHALLVTRTTLPALAGAASWAATLARHYETSLGHAGLVLIGAGHPYSAAETEKTLHLPVVATLPLDPTTAEVLSLGAQPGRGFKHSPLIRSLVAMSKTLQAADTPTREEPDPA